jgi:hypothetical protein
LSVSSIPTSTLADESGRETEVALARVTDTTYPMRSSPLAGRVALAWVVILVGALLAACSTPPLRPNGVVSLAPAEPGAPARVVAVATAQGPAAPATRKRVSVACPSGTVTSGGGIATALIGGAKPPSSLHVGGSLPVEPAGQAPASPGSVPSGWIASGATGGQLVIGGATTAYAMCLHSSAFGRPKVVVASAPGPAVAATTVRATARCPAGEVVLGGGGLATVTAGSASPSLHLIASYPSDGHGAAAIDGASDPSSWSAIADAGGRTGTGVETSAFGLCARARIEVARATGPGPLPPGTATRLTADCPAATELISGGARTGPASGGAPQQGLHLTGSFPSDGLGAGVGSSPAAEHANAWTARAESGGQGSPAGTVTTAFAICLKP